MSSDLITKKIKGCIEAYEPFRFARIRVDNESDEIINLRDVWSCYKDWYIKIGSETHPRLIQDEVYYVFQKEFGISPNPFEGYRGIILFKTEEQIEDYDATKKLEAGF